MRVLKVEVEAAIAKGLVAYATAFGIKVAESCTAIGTHLVVAHTYTPRYREESICRNPGEVSRRHRSYASDVDPILKRAGFFKRAD